MASGINKLAKAVADILRRDDTDRGYDTTAEVKRIEDGTAWVHFPGGEDETPVRMTVNANVGDNVQVRVSGGRAFIIGNGTAPPTDDRVAHTAYRAASKAQEQAKAAQEGVVNAIREAEIAYQVAKIIDETAVTEVVVQYAKNDSSSVAPTTGWSTASPTWEAGKYIWQRTKTTIDGEEFISNTSCIQGAKGDPGTSVTILGSYETEAELRQAHPTGNLGDAYMVSGDLYVWIGSDWEDVGRIQGEQGNTGIGVANLEPQYNLSDSSSSATGTWTTTPPSYVAGKYYWIRTKVTWTDGDISYAPSQNGVLDNALTDANSSAYQALRTAGEAEDIANATAQYFWADDDGVHVASSPETPNATRNTLWNSLGMLFRKGANIILAITTGTNPSIDFYDGTGNDSSNVLATFGNSAIRIGKSTNTRILLDTTNGLRIGDKVALDTSGNASFSGAITATSGRIGGFYITSTSNTGTTGNGGHCFTNSLYVHTSDSTYEYESGLKGDTGGAGNIIYYIKRLATGGSWADAAYVYYVTNSGKLYASNAEIVGKVTATSGKIGGWDLESTAIAKVTSDGNYRVRIQAPASPTTGNYALRIDQKSGSDWINKLALTYGGKLIANDAEISGAITATSGKIGGWNIDSNSIYYGTKSSGTAASDVTLMSSSTFTRTIANISRSSLKLAIGSKFGVNSSGVLYAGEFYCNGNIGVGKKTSSSDGESGAWLTAGGQIHLEAGASSGGSLAFHYNHSASATSSIHESQSGIITVTGKLDADLEGNTSCSGVITAKVASGHTDRTLVGSQSDDGQRVGMIRCTSTSQAGIASQSGTAGSSYAWRNFSVSSSDIRLKKNVEDCEVEDALDVINRIKMHSFDWLHTDEHQKIGFIADELEQIDPKLSMGGGTERDGTINYKSVDTFYMMGYLVKAVQELSEQNRKLTAELNALKEVVK